MDDKKLKDYDLNGKVVHMVQRPPGRPINANNTGQINPERERRRRGGDNGGIFRALDGMVLGTMAIPVFGNNPTVNMVIYPVIGTFQISLTFLFSNQTAHNAHNNAHPESVIDVMWQSHNSR